jgi:NAD(P)-dependent dehydrogenase (short-subunit alcohol dehydrogenase family)
MRLKPVNQQVVVVMGASSGIGRATALCFAAKGAQVVVAARNTKGIEALVAEIRRKGGTAVAVTADVSDAEQVKHVAHQAIAEYGRIDTWAHVSGVVVWAPFEDTRSKELRRVLDVNLVGPMHGAQAALPHLRREGGALIQVSSVAAKVPLPLASVHAASKHGVAGFIDTLRIELRREGAPVSVTQILPAGINTPIFQNALTRLGVEPRPAPPVYDPELVARAIVYAAEHPVRDLVVGGSGVALLLLQRLSPRLVDAILVGRIGFEAQLSRTPKSATATNNLDEPTAAANLKVRGRYGAEALARSPVTALQETGVARFVAKVLDAGVALQGRAVNALYAFRFGRLLGGRARGAQEGGLPAAIRAEERREAEEHQAKKHIEEAGKRKARSEA